MGYYVIAMKDKTIDILGQIFGSIIAAFMMVLIFIVGCVWWVCTGCKKTFRKFMFGRSRYDQVREAEERYS